MSKVASLCATAVYLGSLIESVQYRRGDSASKISVVWDDVATPTIRKGDEEIELSAEKLKKRYLTKDEMSKSSASIGSPSKRKALDFVTDPDAEGTKTWEKTQIDYLKRVILVLDAKCKVNNNIYVFIKNLLWI